MSHTECFAADDGTHLDTDSQQTCSEADSLAASSDADSSSSDSSSSDADSSCSSDAHTGSSRSDADSSSSSDADSNSKAAADSSNRAGAADDNSRDGGTAQAMPQAALAAVLPAEHDPAGRAHTAALVPPEKHSSAVPAPAAEHAIAGSAPINPAVASADPAPAAPAPAGPACASEVQQLFPVLSKKRTLDSMLVGCSSRYKHTYTCVRALRCKCCACRSAEAELCIADKVFAQCGPERSFAYTQQRQALRSCTKKVRQIPQNQYLIWQVF